MYRLTQDGKREIVYDVFSHVLHLLSQELDVRFGKTLLWCSLVSREWASITIPLLYNSVDIDLARVHPANKQTIERARRILPLLRCKSTYFPYGDFIRNLKVATNLVLPIKSDKTALENWVTWLNSRSLEPLALTSLRNLHSLELTRRCSCKCDLMTEENNLVNISVLLEALLCLENLTLFGFWLYEVPMRLNKFECTTFLPENLSLFTACLESISSLEEVDLTFIVNSTDTNPTHSRFIDWTGFKMTPSSLSIRKFRIAISSALGSTYFNPRLASILLRFVAQCRKIRMLSLHHLNIQPKDIVKLSSELTILEDLELSVPSTMRMRFSIAWEQFKSWLRGRSALRQVYFLEPDPLPFREIQRGLKVCREKKSRRNSPLTRLFIGR